MSVAKAQRAANGQPGIGSLSDGTVPGILGKARRLLHGRDAETRHRAQQPLGIGMERTAKQRPDRGLLGLVPGIHDDDPFGHLGDHAEIVGDQHDGGVDLLLQFAHQVEDLRLDRHIERGRRLVGDQQLRVAGERHRDHDALAHAAGKLVRVLLDAAFGLGNVDEPQHRHRLLQRLGAAEALVQAQYLADLAPDRHHRVERGHRLLEDHRDFVAADPPHLGLAEREQVTPGKADRPRDDPARRRGDEAQHGQGGDALAAAGLADDGEGFSGHHPERHPVDGTDDPVAGEEPGAQVLDLEQGRRRRRRGCGLGRDCRRAFGDRHLHPHRRRARRGSSASRNPSPSMLMPSTVIDSMIPGNSTM